MTVAEPAPPTAGGLEPPPARTKRLALAVLVISQLMVVLDATIVNVVLERIQEALAFTSQSDLQWVVTGYALTFGGFLLLGRKLADRLGRRKVFLSGAVLFAVASLLGGLAQDQTLLIAAFVGVLACALAPLFTARRLRRMDVASTLRVME